MNRHVVAFLTAAVCFVFAAFHFHPLDANFVDLGFAAAAIGFCP